jgi:hypothetical protein
VRDPLVAGLRGQALGCHADDERTSRPMTMTDDLDPTEEIILREIHPKPIRLDEIDPEKVVSFDRRSDTLLMHTGRRQ